MFKRRIKASSTICLLVAAIGGILVFSLKESQKGIIDFPLIEGDSLGIYHNPEGPLNWEQVKAPGSEQYFIPVTSHSKLPTSLTLGSSGSSYTWIRIPFENPEDTAKHLCLEVGSKWIDFAQLYIPQKDGRYTTQTTGEIIAYEERAIKARRPAFPITLAPKSQSIYFLLLEEQNHVFVPIIRLWDSIESFNQMLLTENKHMSFHFGIYYSIFLFSAIAYLIIRSKDLLYYLIYIFIAGLTQINLSMLLNVLYPFKLIDSKWFNDSFFVLYALASGFFILFTLEFLETRKYIPRCDKILRILAWLYIAIMPILSVLLVDLYPAIKLIPALHGAITITVICFFVGLFRLWQGSHQAHFYLLAYLIYTISHYRTLYASIVYVEPPAIMIVQWLYGFTLGMIILTIALGDRFFSIRREKEHALQKAYFEAKTFDRLQRNYTQSLHEKVDQQTMALRLANEKKDELFQIVGDNLRTPLQKVTDLSNRITHLSTLENDALFRSQLKIIKSISFNLLNHLENLLKWARLQVESLPFDLKAYKLFDKILNPLIKKHEWLTQENQLTLHSKIDPQLTVYADLNSIRLIFKNLITYASVDEETSNRVTISAVENDSHIRVMIEYSSINPRRIEKKSYPHDPQKHFSIQLCQQLLKLHESELVHSVINEHRNLFEFELERTPNIEL